MLLFLGEENMDILSTNINAMQRKTVPFLFSSSDPIFLYCYILEVLYRYIGYLNNYPLKSNNIGYWTPRVGRVTEYRSSKNGQYATATVPIIRHTTNIPYIILIYRSGDEI